MTDLTAARALEIVRRADWNVLTADWVRPGMTVEPAQLERCRLLFSAVECATLYWDLDLDEVFFLDMDDECFATLALSSGEILLY